MYEAGPVPARFPPDTFPPTDGTVMTATLLFDLDGTLVDTAPDLWASLNVVLNDKGLESVPFERVGYLVGQGALVMIERGLKEHGVTVEKDELKKLHEHFLEYYTANIAVGSTPFPGVEAALDRLAARGHRLAVCTNKYEALSVQLLETLGMADRFAAICGPDTFGVKKPDPEHIWRTIDKAGGRRDHAVMVGDSISDIAAAKAAGVPVIAVPFGYTDKPVAELDPDVVIDHFDEIDAAIASVSARARTA